LEWQFYEGKVGGWRFVVLDRREHSCDLVRGGFCRYDMVVVEWVAAEGRETELDIGKLGMVSQLGAFSP